MSVSMGLNSVIIPLFMEGNEEFSDFGTSLILSNEAFCAIVLCLLFYRVIKPLGFIGGLVVSAAVRTFAILLLGVWSDMYSWLALTFFLGAGTFMYIILMQTWINNIKFNKFKGVVYSVFGTSISLGIATGPLVYNDLNSEQDSFILNLLMVQPELPSQHYEFFVSAIINVVALNIALFGFLYFPKFPRQNQVNIFKIIKSSKGIFFAVALCGVSFFGVAWYITLYGVRNNMSMFEASVLLSAFMIGSVCLDTPLTWLSEFIDRRYMIVFSALICTLLAIFLPLAIYNKYQAYVLMFIWGGVISSMYSNCLIIMEERYSATDSITANAAFSFMENSGAAIGLVIMGTLLGYIGPDGFSYVIMLACISYFTFALSRYKMQYDTSGKE